MVTWMLHDLERKVVKPIDKGCLTIREWLKLNFCAWGFYRVIMTQPGVYQVWDKFADILCYEIKKEVQG